MASKGKAPRAGCWLRIFSNFAHVEQNSAKASGSSALQPNGRK